MPSFRTGTVVAIREVRDGLQRVDVDLAGSVERAYVLTRLTGTVEEGDEVVVDRTYQSQYGVYDKLFTPDEMAGLHLSSNDYATILGASRLRQLMPFNFELNLQARAIRRLRGRQPCRSFRPAASRRLWPRWNRSRPCAAAPLARDG